MSGVTRAADGPARVVRGHRRARRLHRRQRGYGGNCSILRQTHDEVGGHAADLLRETDFEFAYRLHVAGVEFVYLPDAEVTEYRTKGWLELLAESEVNGSISVELCRRHPPMIEQMELARYRNWPRVWRAMRATGLALHVPPAARAPPGFVLPRDRWARLWFRYVWNYAHWRGIRAAADPDLWHAARAGTLRAPTSGPER